MRSTSLFVAVVIAAGMNAVSGTVVSAQTGVVSACANRMDGRLRLATAASPCKATELPVSWSAAGPQGPEGPAGPAGSPGAAGPAGAEGPEGVVSTNANGAYDFTNVNGFVATGGGSGNLGETGPGTRVVWYPAKSAFRAGAVSGTQWDDSNIGHVSTALGLNTTARGQFSTAMGSDTTASGAYSTAMGYFTAATGSHSTAMGFNASTNGQEGAFVYGDRSTFFLLDALRATAPNQFLVRAAGGTTFYSNGLLTAGVSLAPGGGAWDTVSDVHMKTNFRDLDGETVLTRLAQIPIREWSYITQDAAIRHVGPTAQDFRAAFGLGDNERTISTLDPDGISLKAIQALHARTDRLQANTDRLQEENAALRAELARLREAVEQVGRR